MQRETLFDTALRKVKEQRRWKGMVALRAAVDPSDVDQLIAEGDERVINAILSMTGKGGTIRAVDTGAKKFIEKIIRAAVWDKRMYALFGPTGCGKTFCTLAAIEEFQGKAVRVRINEYNRSSRSALLDDIAKALKIQTSAGQWIYGSKIFGRLKEQFENNTTAIILDEAQKMRERTFEMIRDVYDETALSFVLLGSMSFRDQLAKKKIGDEVFGQFLRRIDDRYELPHTTWGDVKLFLGAYGISIDNSEAKQIAKKISKWGDIDTLAKAMRLIAGDVDEGELTWTKVGAGNISDAIDRIIMLMDINTDNNGSESK